MRRASIAIIFCWLPGALGFLITAALGPVMNGSWSGVFTLLFAVASYVFLVNAVLMPLFVLSGFAALVFVYISARKVASGDWSRKTLILATIALVGHGYFYFLYRFFRH